MREPRFFTTVMAFGAYLLTPGNVTAQVEPPPENAFDTSVAVTGERSRDGRYHMTLEFDSKDAPGFFDALEIWAMPSQTLLFVHRDENAVSWTPPEPALAWVQGPLDTFTHQISLPYDPRALGDRFLSINLRNEGCKFPVLRTPLQRDFRVGVATHAPATTLTETELSEGAPDFSVACGNGERCHCCAGGNCEQMCDCCDVPAFDCDLAQCTSGCGEWPAGCV